MIEFFYYFLGIGTGLGLAVLIATVVQRTLRKEMKK
jgi:hypothetical protein